MKRLILAGTGTALVLAAGTVWWTSNDGVHRDRGIHSASSPSSPSSTSTRIANREALLDERLKAAKEISSDLRDGELRELHALLSRPIDERHRENDLVAINEVMNQLRVFGLACGEYATALCNLIRDPQVHPVVRDYAIQHAVQWMRDARDPASPVQITELDRRRLLDCTVAFLQEPASLHETGFGTALHSLRTLESIHPEAAAEVFALCSPRIAGVAAGSESAPLANRISAIQSLAALPDRDAARALVRELFAAAPAGSPVRLALVAALGDTGDRPDLDVLRRLEKDEPRLTYAARSAAGRLESRLSVSR